MGPGSLWSAQAEYPEATWMPCSAPGGSGQEAVVGLLWRVHEEGKSPHLARRAAQGVGEPEASMWPRCVQHIYGATCAFQALF